MILAIFPYKSPLNLESQKNPVVLRQIGQEVPKLWSESKQTEITTLYKEIFQNNVLNKFFMEIFDYIRTK